MKFILTILSGVIVGIVVAYFAQDWKEEKLIFTLTEPAKFGDISFQNLEIRNEGFDPATNVKVYLPKDILESRQIALVAKFDLKGDTQSMVGGLERIRRGEHVLVSFTSKKGSVSSDDVTIKSDRSMATYSLPNVWTLDNKSFWMGTGVGFGFLIFITLGVSVPAYKDYQKRAREVRQRTMNNA